MKIFRPLISVLTGLLVLTALLFAGSSAHAQTASQFYAEGVEAVRAGDVAGAKKKLRLSLEVDKNFRPASALLDKINAAETEKARNGSGTQTPGSSANTLERMVVPVEFKDTTLQSALEFLRQRVDADSGGKLKINFVLNLPPELENRKVTLQLNHVPVTETLRYIGNLAGVHFEIQKFAIVVTPATSQSPTATPGVSPTHAP